MIKFLMNLFKRKKNKKREVTFDEKLNYNEEDLWNL